MLLHLPSTREKRASEVPLRRGPGDRRSPRMTVRDVAGRAGGPPVRPSSRCSWLRPRTGSGRRRTHRTGRPARDGRHPPGTGVVSGSPRGRGGRTGRGSREARRPRHRLPALPPSHTSGVDEQTPFRQTDSESAYGPAPRDALPRPRPGRVATGPARGPRGGLDRIERTTAATGAVYGRRGRVHADDPEPNGTDLLRSKPAAVEDRDRAFTAHGARDRPVDTQQSTGRRIEPEFLERPTTGSGTRGLLGLDRPPGISHYFLWTASTGSTWSAPLKNDTPAATHSRARALSYRASAPTGSVVPRAGCSDIAPHAAAR